MKVNTVNGTKGSIGSQYLTGCIMGFMQSRTDASMAAIQGPRIDVTPKYYYNPYMDYKKFMVPALIVIAVTAGLGLLVSNYSDNAQQAMFVMMFFVLIFMLMSGIFTPISSMPEWAQYITYANPLRYYADAMRSIFLKGSTLADVWYDAVGLLAIGTGAVTWAILSYKKTN